ncbi:MAG: UvrD-helicase domain-containing protein, partial [Verrucomicrobiales bacterium]|nr:UvrD-helicase domain-containing protein [Verrucomicrobiales bacterium]
GDLAEALDAVARAGDATGMKRGRITEWRRPLKPLIEEATELQALVSPLPGTESDPLAEDWDLARRDVLALLELVGRFTEAVAIARRATAVVDFADLEQFALRLLWDPVGSTPTPLAREWRERLELVFVDEYQDINGAQDRIIDCVSREGAAANRFFVGDVKQSIYRFRRADPRIFQHYAAAWREGPHRRVIPLAENFRSHERILGFVNTWFEGLMRPSVGGVGYDAEARLVYGAAEARPALREAPEGRVEIVLVPRSATDVEPGGEGVEEGAPTSDDLDQEESQAEVAAARLKEWHDTGLRVVDAAAGGTRPVAWRDMVVLHPSPRPVAERWARQFARRGVPLDARRSGFFEALEVSDLINLARILDNPVQDHALLAVLRSPLVGMTVDELAVVRWVDRKAPLWDALMRCARGGGAAGVGTDADPAWRGAWEGARVRASEFLEAYRRWRRLAREGALSLCLERALVETTFEAWLRAQPRAASRLANVKRLLALTRQFDQFRRHGLFRFLQFLDAQIQAEEEAESAPASVAGSVRLMSVHQSKGLEFPVVVVAGLGRRFNLADVREDWLLDPELGICPPVLSASGDRSHASAARWVAARRQRSELAGEQVRLLYVACTRAAERLVLLGDVTAKSLATWAEPGSDTLGDRDVLAASSPIAWLGRRMPVLTGVDDWVIRGSGRGTWADWRIVDTRPAAPEQAEPRSCESPGAGIDEDVLREVTARLEWHYPWPDALEEPGKVAVTTLSRKYATDDEASDWTPSSTWRAPASERSAASSTEAVERGAAHHLFCEWVDLERTATSAALADEVRRLAEEGVLSEEQVAMLDLPALAGFWVSPLGHRLREQSRFVERELPFTTRLGPQEFARLGGATAHGFGPEDFQVVQGVVDLAVILPGEIWIVDFKTDRVSGAALTERIQKYQLQLRLYAHALTSIYRRPVTQRWLWFFHPRELVAVAP